ncbi:serine/threonine protein phosphatase [Lentzea sp. NBRC 105346]|uniref:serine/threonine protein phosphatase n=1 Tax=Lentzea sp. NBRC 105346 TaxID=3032205 RepID=UPI0024A42E16|nr:serine/threonine protein phosphatase [Lentzea sp. NBRC 105346]GLZ28638.1 serine/threonine protein phosphatase [Lentzea sp. NBRC 105346]
MLMQRTVDTASSLGLRQCNADAVASGDPVFALADGIGDNPAAAHAARLAADAAVLAGDPVAGVLAASAALGSAAGDAVLVVAAARHDGYDVAWVGDARAYHWDGDTLSLLTRDQTVAEYFRSRGAVPAPRMEHVVTNTVRHCTPDNIGRASVGSGTLVLTSDGVHGVLSHAEIAAIAGGGDAAARLVRAALHAGGTDNATALVVGRNQ